MAVIRALKELHHGTFAALQGLTQGWFLGLSARVVFSSVLLIYFLNSAATKVGSGFPGMLIAQLGAYAQIVPPIAEQYGYDASKIPFLPYGLVVYAGTYAEVILPLLVLVGLFTRLASIGMLGFIAVMSYVDIAFHGIDEKAIGHFFDRIHDSALSDQRLLWVFPLVYLILRGPGLISLDTLLGRLMRQERI